MTLLSVLAFSSLTLMVSGSKHLGSCIPVANSPVSWAAVDSTAAVSLSAATADDDLGRSGVRLEFHSTKVYHNADFSRRFDAPVDAALTPLLSFNLFKIGQPTQLAVSVRTPAGLYMTERADLFDERNSISVDLTAKDFAFEAEAAYTSSIAGLSLISEVTIHLYSEVEGSGAAYVDEMTFCTSDFDFSAAAVEQDEEASDRVESFDVSELQRLNKKLRSEHNDPDVQLHISALQEEIRSLKKRQVDDTGTVAALRDVVSEVIGKFGEVLTDSVYSMSTLLDKVTKKTKETADTLEDIKGKFHGRLQSQHARIESLKRHVDDLEESVAKINHARIESLKRHVDELEESVAKINQGNQTPSYPSPSPSPSENPSGMPGKPGDWNNSDESNADLFNIQASSGNVRRSASTSGSFRVPLPTSQ